MKTYAGLDGIPWALPPIGCLSTQQETQICVISEDGEVLFEGKCPTNPKQIAKV